MRTSELPHGLDNERLVRMTRAPQFAHPASLTNIPMKRAAGNVPAMQAKGCHINTLSSGS